jgi:hypothetical protein
MYYYTSKRVVTAANAIVSRDVGPCPHTLIHIYQPHSNRRDRRRLLKSGRRSTRFCVSLETVNPRTKQPTTFHQLTDCKLNQRSQTANKLCRWLHCIWLYLHAWGPRTSEGSTQATMTVRRIISMLKDSKDMVVYFWALSDCQHHRCVNVCRLV